LWLFAYTFLTGASRGGNDDKRLSGMREVDVQTATPSDSAPTVGVPAVEQNRPKEHPSATEAPEQRDLFARAQRRKLPDERKSITHKFSVGGHEGYIIVGMYEEGALGEIFIKMAKEGSTLSGFMDGLALSISIGLQYGVPLKALVDKLTNTRFEPSGFTENPSIRYASSVLDYIARWLGGKFLSPEYLKSRAGISEHELNQPATIVPSVSAKEREPGHRGNSSAKVGGDAPSCPTCGMLMVPNGSCYKCVNCGSTSGCS
jgi:ribonucleoside-diphosphate reductase alpha chain